MHYTIRQAKLDLERIESCQPLVQRMLKVAHIITKVLETEVTQINDKPIIVGGLAMEIYTHSEYTTHDIDFVTTSSIRLAEILLELGFKKETIYEYEPLKVAVQIMSEPLDPMRYEDTQIIEFEDKTRVYCISKEGLLYNRALDYQSLDNRNYSIYLLIQDFDTIDTKQILSDLEKQDIDACKAFKEWINIAIEKRKKFN
ncbi:hypothetical protein [Macrococcoides caseolyticum]|uniref:hypothetical protein n=1 Tax=Macrococcoides caseolyticum TaxID=69966 RepID=UPI000C324F2F|nr:hypothetical protein [Macrococcus caseolyticus]PKE12173.1 hypothetical protein CW685_04155 [Macrococcus caseolyticus]PKE48702.1 hypothetical protein CW677_03515 [Macrococcus caseolyticus]PKF15753.1 hypothetical protein CW690_03515 [Macrococcus caseolyticus]QQB05945.1 hypothetical protein I6H62_01935 [Macrococcus caseolyticus]TDM28685.1 hypothetical protein ETH98_08710 [Macrococcus caseolyticus]